MQALIKEIMKGDVDSVVDMLDLCAALKDGKDGHGMSVMHYAALSDSSEMCNQLRLHGAKGNVVDHYGHTPLHLAVINGCYNSFDYLSSGAKYNRMKDYAGCLPLHYAAYYGRTDMVEPLCLRNPSAIGEVNNSGYTPLMLAAAKGHADVCRILIKYGADVNRVDKSVEDGETVLMLAAERGHTDVCALLLDNGADTACISREGCNALHLAGNASIADMLVKAGLPVDSRTDVKDETPLHCAAAAGLPDVCEALIRMGADVNAVSGTDRTALLWAVEAGNEQVVKLLLDNGADASFHSDREDCYVINYVCNKFNTNILAMLLKAGAKVDSATGKDKFTLLHEAAWHGNAAATEALIDAGASIELKDMYKETALFTAACHGYTEVCRILLRHGARVNNPNHCGITPLGIAVDHGHDETAALLREAGGVECLEPVFVEPEVKTCLK